MAPFGVRVSKGVAHCISSEPLDLFLIGFFMQYSLAKSKENVAFKILIADHDRHNAAGSCAARVFAQWPPART